ncbi:ribosome maturation factor RimM [Microlunatus aurantiacus]|uniref:Ribosome maturation factor RimM n=1 Tax=Microlunatus aurantiacus TaxID=446786 RepID=A0ABP7E065_9ACTN
MSDTVEVIVGIVGRAHGIKGEVGIDVRTDEPDRRFVPGAVLGREGGGSELTVESARDHSGRLLVRFRGHPDRTAVETLRGTVLVVQVDATARPDDEEEYYDRQLTGLRVLDAVGAEVGRVADVIHLPEQDMLEIRTEAGPRLVPFVRALVPEVDLGAGTVRLADVPGLLTDLDDTPAEQPGPDAAPEGDA